MDRELVASVFIFVIVALLVLHAYPVKTDSVVEIDLNKRVRNPHFNASGNDVVYVGFDLRLSPKEQIKIYAPLMEYLSARTGKQFRIKFEDNYRAVQEDIGKGKIQFAFIGPVSYAIAKQKYRSVIPILSCLGEDGSTYRAVIFTSTESDIETLEELEGKTFAFGSYYSTQGYLIPRMMLEEAGITLDKLRRYAFLGSHQACAEAVIAGEFDAGGMQDSLAYKLQKDGLIRILAISKPFPRSLVVANKNVDKELILKVKKALLELDPQGKDAELTRWEMTEFPAGFAEVNEKDYMVYYPLIRRYID